MASLPVSKSGSGSGSGGSGSGANGDKRLLVNNNNNKNNDHGLQPPRGLGLSDPPISPAVTTGTASSGNFTDMHMRQLIRPKKFRTLSNASSILSDIFNHPDANEDELKNKIKEANDRDREALYKMNESLRSTPPPPPAKPLPSTQSGQRGSVDEEKKHRSGLWGLFKRKSFKAAKKRIKSAPPQIVVPEPPAAGGATTTTHTTEDGHRQTVISIPAQPTFNLGPVPRSPGFGLSPKSPITGTPIRPPRPSIGLETLIEHQETNERHSQVPASAPVIPPINDGLNISPLLPTEDFSHLQRVSGFTVPPAESPPELPQAQEASVGVDDGLDVSSSSKRISCQDHTLPEFVSPASPLHLSVCLSTAQSSRDRRSNMSSGFKLPDIDHTEERLDREVDGGETLAEVSEPSSSNSSHHRLDTAAGGRDRIGSADVSSLSSVASSSDQQRPALASTKLRRQRSLYSNPSFTKRRVELERTDALGGESVKTNGNQSTAFYTPPDLPSGYATEPDTKALSSALEKVKAVQLPPLRFTPVMTVADLKPLSCKSSGNLRPVQSEETKRQDGEPEQSSDGALRNSDSSSEPLSGVPSTDSFQTSISIANSSTPQATPLSAPSNNLTKPLQLRRTNGIICPPLRISSSSSSSFSDNPSRYSRNGNHRSGSHIDFLQQCEEFRHSKEKELDTLRDRLRQLENRNSWLLTAVTKQLPDGYYPPQAYQDADDDYNASEEEEKGRPHSRSTVSSSPILSGFRVPTVSPRDQNSNRNGNGNDDDGDILTPRGRHFNLADPRPTRYDEHQNNISSSRASASDRWSMTSQHTFGSTTVDDSAAGTGTGMRFSSSSNLTTGFRLTPPVQHTQHPRYNPSPVVTSSNNSGSCSGSGDSSGNSRNASLSAVRRPTPAPTPISIPQAKPTLVTRSYTTCSTTDIPVFSRGSVGSGRGQSFASTTTTTTMGTVTGYDDTNMARDGSTNRHLAIQTRPTLSPNARRERSLPRDPRLASFSSRSRSRDGYKLHMYHGNRSHDGYINGFVDSSSSNGSDDNNQYKNVANNGNGSRNTSITRSPAPLPPSLTYKGLSDTAAQRREEREYRKKQEEIMRQLASGSRGQQLNTLRSSSSSASLGVVRQQQGQLAGAASASTSARSTALYNGYSSGSGYESDQGYGGNNGINGNTSYHDGRDPLTRLRDLRENVGRAISGIGIGLAVTTGDDSGCVYDGYGDTYHEQSDAGYDGYGQHGYGGYGSNEGGGYGIAAGHGFGREREDGEDRREGEGQEGKEGEADGEYRLSSSFHLPRHHLQNRDQRNNSPLPFSMPSWPSLPSLSSLPSLAGPSHSSLETEEWFPSLYRTHTQQTQTENDRRDSPNDQPRANSNSTTNNTSNRRTIRRKTTIAAMNGNKPSTSSNGNGNRNEWDTLEPLMRELIGNKPNSNGASGSGASSANGASGVDDQHRINYNGAPTPLVDKVFGLAPMDEEDLAEEALEDSVNLLQ
ncbi:hypothetical protein QBC45DRAFT_455883 [Copromyces sp. CBS 386.78]|nr:hypothetical protein QBC45DRAFT_455883 [Copromyces sp. CBS 386.78]